MAEVIAVITDLRTLLAALRGELKAKRANKRQISHALAKGFMDLLESEGVRILLSLA